MSEEKQLVKVTEKTAAPVACIGVGAAVGSMIAPGVGTAVGSGIGAIIWGTATIIKAAKENRKKRNKTDVFKFYGLSCFKIKI